MAAAGAAAGCTASAEDVRPPADRLFFPTGVAISPDETSLFVISANSELRYDSGTISVLDLDAVEAVVTGWLTSGAIPQGCRRDEVFSETLTCSDESWGAFLRPGAGVRIGNFATRLAVQDTGGGDLRLVVPVRGDPSVTWIDWRAADDRLHCSDASGFALCDDEHRLIRFLDSADLPLLVDEPFGVTVDSAGEWGMVTHLTSGTVTLVDLPVDGRPILADVLGGLFAPSPTTGARGSLAVASRTPGEPDNIAYVTSRTENRVQTFSVARAEPGALPELVPGAFFFLDRGGGNSGSSSDTRGAVFGQGGDLGYFMNRAPPSLTLLDASRGPTGAPRNDVLVARDLCREGSDLAVADTGAGERAYVTCFQAGELHVFDPRGAMELVAITAVGRGPFGAVAAPGRGRLYISNFFEDTIAVVDLIPGSLTQYRVVLRIGASS